MLVVKLNSILMLKRWNLFPRSREGRHVEIIPNFHEHPDPPKIRFYQSINRYLYHDEKMNIYLKQKLIIFSFINLFKQINSQTAYLRG